MTKNLTTSSDWLEQCPQLLFQIHLQRWETQHRKTNTGLHLQDKLNHLTCIFHLDWDTQTHNYLRPDSPVSGKEMTRSTNLPRWKVGGVDWFCFSNTVENVDACICYCSALSVSSSCRRLMSTRKREELSNPADFTFSWLARLLFPFHCH